MRQSRMKLAAETAVYHLMSRTSRGVFLFNETEKEKMRELLWKVAGFCGVEVITYALMSNHFHLLVRVPEKTVADASVTDEELLNRAAELRNDASMDLLRLFHKKHLEKQAALAANPEAVVDDVTEKQARMWEVNKAELLAQMHDLSIFMKMFKQRVSMSYNKRHETFGRLWADRFKSQLVEDRSSALQIVAAYIDLNGVRAGLADDPKDYRFCGYAEAMAGNAELQRQLAGVMNQEPIPIPVPGPVPGTSVPVDSEGNTNVKETESLIAAKLAQYRLWILQEGQALEGVAKKSAGVSSETLRAAVEAGGELSQAQVLRLRVRYFIDGAAIGGRGFVEKVFATHRTLFGPKRETGARPIRGAQLDDLKVLRDLRTKVFGVPKS